MQLTDEIDKLSGINGYNMCLVKECISLHRRLSHERMYRYPTSRTFATRKVHIGMKKLEGSEKLLVQSLPRRHGSILSCPDSSVNAKKATLLLMPSSRLPRVPP